MVTRELPTGTLTFFFSDIEGSTKLVSRLGRTFRPILEEHDRLLRAAFEPFGGVEVRTVGDAFFVAFPTADGAARAAVAAQRTLATALWPEGASVRVRIGLHTGTGELGGGDYVGLDVHLAARIAGAAHGGQIVVSDATKALLRETDELRLIDLGAHRLKDVGSVRLWQLSAPGLPDRFPAIASLEPIRNLPVDATPFTGREREVGELIALLRDARLLTLTGPGGTGKTRLSLRVAAESAADFRDGTHFVGLAPITDPSLIGRTIAQALSLPEDPGRPVEDVLTAHLATRELLLVLDNCEQLIQGAPIVSRLLGAAPRLRCLATSREALHLYGEQEYPVPVLSTDDATALFALRARSVRPSFALTSANEPTVRAIGERLDRLPLAIELAAARIKLFSPDQIRDRLDRSLELLTSGARDLPERQRTLRGAIAWSHDLLSETERTMFRRLSVFVGDIPLQVVGRVCDPGGVLGADPLDVLGQLVDKNLIRRNDERGDEPSFAMLETIREFAAQQLEAAGEAQIVPARHAICYVKFAEQLEADLMGAEAEPTLNLVERQNDNLRATFTWSVAHDPAVGLRLGAAIWRFWQHRGHLREGREVMERLVALPPATASTSERVRALTALGGVAYWQGDFVRARTVYEESLALAEQLADQRLIADGLYGLAFLDIVDRRVDDARAKLERSLAIHRAVGDDAGIAMVGSGLVAALYRLGEYASAYPLGQEVIAKFRALGRDYQAAGGEVMQACIAVGSGDLAAAARHMRNGLDGMLAAGDSGIGAIVVAALVAAELGDAVRAARLMAAAERMRGAEAVVGGPIEIFGVPDPAEKAKAMLDPVAFATAAREGAMLSRDGVIAEARAVAAGTFATPS